MFTVSATLAGYIPITQFSVGTIAARARSHFAYLPVCQTKITIFFADYTFLFEGYKKEPHELDR